jgi:DAK2 domain fusion protein YloV
MMQQQYLDGIALHQLFESGYRNLKKNINTINDLNVFPVPDGDTGTNMTQTFGGGLRGVPSTDNVGQYMGALSHAALLSARGNSGVIFSQFVHGLYRGFAQLQKVSFADFAYAFSCAKEDAYGSILTPTEGTILTVIREAAEFLAANGNQYTDFQDGFAALLNQMKASLAKTPELLPILKESGVVDSGGAGLVCFVEGMYAHLCGESIEDTPDFADTMASAAVSSTFGPDSQLEYGYCTEFILQLMHAKTDIASFDREAFIKPLEELGDSIVVVCSDSIVKVHIHSFTPEKVLEYGRKFGEFLTLKIENMSVQHSETQTAPQKEHLKYAVVAVAPGEGIAEYFTEIGANAIIAGGQTCNPSVDAFLEAFQKFDAEHIIVLPNNSNVVLTAQQAADIYKEADVRVLPAKSIVEGCSALSLFNPWCDDVEELLSDMESALHCVTTAYLTTAIRDTHIGGIDVVKGNFIGLDRETILACGENKVDTTMALISRITEAAPKDIIVVFTGKEAAEAEVAELENRLHSAYPMADIGFIDGKQEVYDFIISLE